MNMDPLSERYIPESPEYADNYRYAIEHRLYNDKETARLRFKLACHEIGEPPMRDLEAEERSRIEARQASIREMINMAVWLGPEYKTNT